MQGICEDCPYGRALRFRASAFKECRAGCEVANALGKQLGPGEEVFAILRSGFELLVSSLLGADAAAALTRLQLLLDVAPEEVEELEESMDEPIEQSSGQRYRLKALLLLDAKLSRDTWALFTSLPELLLASKNSSEVWRKRYLSCLESA